MEGLAHSRTCSTMPEMPAVKDAKVFIQTSGHRRGSRRSKALNVTAAVTDSKAAGVCTTSWFLLAFLPPPSAPPTVSVCSSDASSCGFLCLPLPPRPAHLPASLRLALLSSLPLTCSSPVTLRVGWLKEKDSHVLVPLGLCHLPSRKDTLIQSLGPRCGRA